MLDRTVDSVPSKKVPQNLEHQRLAAERINKQPITHNLNGCHHKSKGVYKIKEQNCLLVLDETVIRCLKENFPAGSQIKPPFKWELIKVTLTKGNILRSPSLHISSSNNFGRLCHHFISWPVQLHTNIF